MPMGMFKPGQSGNPRGRPRKDQQATGEQMLKRALRELETLTPRAIQKLAVIMDDDVNFKSSEQLKAAIVLIEKALVVRRELDTALKGEKPSQPLTEDSDEGTTGVATLSLTVTG